VGFTTCTVRRRPPRSQSVCHSSICAIQDENLACRKLYREEIRNDMAEVE
jgi:hypothetical protein